jgi:hypothetical protein
MNTPANRDEAPERLKAAQHAFAGHIRDPETVAAPEGIEDRRMEVYRALFFNNIRRFVSNNFPVLRQLHDDESWNRLVREFFAGHRCQTPLFPELPREFLRYLQEGRQVRADDPPFMLELAHYEWVELALSLDEHEHDDISVDRETDLLDGVPLLSPLAWPLSYRYPVHQIRPEFQPQQPPDEATHLLAYRDRQDKVKFMQLNDISRLLLNMMQEDRGLTGREMLNEIAASIGHPEPDRVTEAGLRLLQDLMQKDVVLGSVAAESTK